QPVDVGRPAHGALRRGRAVELRLRLVGRSVAHTGSGRRLVRSCSRLVSGGTQPRPLLPRLASSPAPTTKPATVPTMTYHQLPESRTVRRIPAPVPSTRPTAV